MDMTEFMPHGQCWNWTWRLIFLHVISDAIIALSYLSIPLMLVFYIKNKKNLAFKWIFILFAMFITTCSITHIMGIITVWKPLFWIEGWAKFVCAIISMITAISLFILFPEIIKFKSSSERAAKKLEKALKEKDEIINRITKINNQIDNLQKKTVSKI